MEEQGEGPGSAKQSSRASPPASAIQLDTAALAIEDGRGCLQCAGSYPAGRRCPPHGSSEGTVTQRNGVGAALPPAVLQHPAACEIDLLQ